MRRERTCVCSERAVGEDTAPQTPSLAVGGG